MILVAVIDINIVATTCVDLNHFVRNILKSEFIQSYAITDELNDLWVLLMHVYSINKNFKAFDSLIFVVTINSVEGGFEL